MLSCKDVADRASALIDGELSGRDALRIRLHLVICKGCSRFVGQMRLTDRLTAEVADPDRPLQNEAMESRLGEILSTLREGRLRR